MARHGDDYYHRANPDYARSSRNPPMLKTRGDSKSPRRPNHVHFAEDLGTKKDLSHYHNERASSYAGLHGGEQYLVHQQLSNNSRRHYHAPGPHHPETPSHFKKPTYELAVRKTKNHHRDQAEESLNRGEHRTRQEIPHHERQRQYQDRAEHFRHREPNRNPDSRDARGRNEGGLMEYTVKRSRHRSIREKTPDGRYRVREYDEYDESRECYHPRAYQPAIPPAVRNDSKETRRAARIADIDHSLDKLRSQRQELRKRDDGRFKRLE